MASSSAAGPSSTSAPAAEEAEGSSHDEEKEESKGLSELHNMMPFKIHMRFINIRDPNSLLLVSQFSAQKPGATS